jgi:predicted transcriptional regulator
MKNAVHYITRQNILEAIRSAQELFNSIAADTYSDTTLSDSVKLSRKQYYNKLSILIKVDLIKRKGGRYLLTPFGRVIFGVQLGFGDAVDNHLKTKIQSLIINSHSERDTVLFATVEN